MLLISILQLASPTLDVQTQRIPYSNGVTYYQLYQNRITLILDKDNALNGDAMKEYWDVSCHLEMRSIIFFFLFL